MEVPVDERVEKVQNRMNEQDVDLILLTSGPNTKYLTGFEMEVLRSHMLLAIPKEGEPEFFAPSIIKNEVRETGVETILWDSDKLPVQFERFLGNFKVDRVLLDDSMKEVTSRDVRDIIDAELGLASEVMAYVRAVKTEEELENIREAVKIADQVFQDIRELDPVGMTENALADFIEEKMSEYGGEGPSFSTIVASGPNGADPHHLCSDREIRGGEPVVVDFGCLVNGYPSDQTRTIVFGNEEPSEKFKEVFELVRKAQQMEVEKVRPGVTNRAVGEASRDFLRENGFEEKLLMGRGHGIGIEIHEDPKIPSRDHEITMELKPGMVFTCEPGVYIEGEFGVRIEDLVVVTEDGCERLNQANRGWKQS